MASALYQMAGVIRNSSGGMKYSERIRFAVKAGLDSAPCPAMIAQKLRDVYNRGNETAIPAPSRRIEYLRDWRAFANVDLIIPRDILLTAGPFIFYSGPASGKAKTAHG